MLTFNISNVTKHGTLQWTVTETSDWLDIAPNNGTTSDELDQITVSVDRTCLNYGNHTTQLQISSNGGEVYVDVLLVVVNPNAPQLTIDMPDIDFGDRETSRQFNISNTGTGNLIWSITEGYNWLGVTPTNGSTSNETEAVIITVSRNDLEQDVYSANLSVTSNGGNVSINIRMEVSDSVIPPVTMNDPSDVTETSMKLTWTRISHSNFAFYRLYRSVSPGVNENSTMIFESASSVNNTYTETGLIPATTYYYKVFVVDLEGVSSNSNEVRATTRMKTGSWSLVRSFNSTYFQDIDLINENSGFIAGFINGRDPSYRPNVLYFNGNNFSDEELPNNITSKESEYQYVSCVSANNVWVVGGYHQWGSNYWLINFNGTEWITIEEYPSVDPHCIHASVTGIVWIGGYERILRYDGDEFRQFDVNNNERIYDFLYLNDKDIYCASNMGIIRYYDGFGWADIGDVEGSLSAIDGTSPDDLWITGFNGIYHYNGIEWEHIDAVSNFRGLDIEVINESLVWFTGTSGKIYLFDGNDFISVENPLTINIFAIEFCDGIGWAVDSRGNVARYSE
jgi:hypothetical protein